MIRSACALLTLGLLAACSAPTLPPPVAAPVPAPTAAGGYDTWYRGAAAAGKAVYRIDPATSLITVLVRRGGPLARLGHDHVIASRSVAGFVAPDEGRADFQFRLDALRVDEPALREAAGLTAALPPAAIDGTRTNMLTKVLDADRYPVVMLSARRSAPNSDTLSLAITLHGVTRTVDVPASIERSPRELTASGKLTLRQTDFGIVPMSVMGGAMVVQDEMSLSFNIQARRP